MGGLGKSNFVGLLVLDDVDALGKSVHCGLKTFLTGTNVIEGITPAVYINIPETRREFVPSGLKDVSEDSFAIIFLQFGDMERILGLQLIINSLSLSKDQGFKFLYLISSTFVKLGVVDKKKLVVFMLLAEKDLESGELVLPGRSQVLHDHLGLLKPLLDRGSKLGKNIIFD